MLTNVDKKVAKSRTVFECKKCDYVTCKKNDYNKHIHTKKHECLHNVDKKSQKVATSLMVCVCGKSFKYRQSLFVHRKKCDNQEKIMTETDALKNLLRENQEFKELILEQSSKMLELANKPTIITNNNTSNCNNKQFNLNVFLNEKCKNAMNMSDFVNSIKIMDNDFEDIGKLGYVQGISNIFVKGLKNLDETMRPVHCNDIKREILYIKNNDVWEKDNNKEKMKQVIAEIAHKNVKYIPIWRDSHPEALDGTTKTNDQYMRIANQVMTATVPDDDIGINKIIRTVAYSVCIDK